MRYISFDSVGGASGDMLLGALLDLGADLAPMTQIAGKMLPEGIEISQAAAADRGLHGTRATVRIAGAPATTWIEASDRAGGHEEHAHARAAAAELGRQQHHGKAEHGRHEHAPHQHTHAPHRGLADILKLLDHPALPDIARRLAVATFKRLAAAEAGVHGVTPEEVHFHEVGAADAIADVVCCCLALEQLGVQGVRVGPLPAGYGTISCAHGEMPNPAPATLRLLEGCEIVQVDEPFELVTPTGAALLATWRDALPPPPARGRVARSGYGFGQRALNHRPNVLRATLYEADERQAGGAGEESLTLLETNLDDCNPQWIGDLIERLLAAGARDAWATPIVMKKGRPALLLSALCEPESAAPLQNLIFAATPTFGVRALTVARTALQRRIETVATPFGPVRMKIGLLEGREITRTPEFEDCAARAREADVTPRQVAEAAR